MRHFVLFAWQSGTLILLDSSDSMYRLGLTTRELQTELCNSDITFPDEAGIYFLELLPSTIHYPAGDCDLVLNGEARLATAGELELFVADEYWYPEEEPDNPSEIEIASDSVASSQ